MRFNMRAKGRPKPVTIKALLDSGGSASLITSKFAKKLKAVKSKNQTKWSMAGGVMTTQAKAKVQFTLPKLDDRVLSKWNLHVAKDLGAYDMIIGRDILEDLGIDIQFSDQTVEWSGQTMPFKDRDCMA